jgi:hypothetical protein
VVRGDQWEEGRGQERVIVIMDIINNMKIS